MDVTVNIPVRITSNKEGHFAVSVEAPAASGHLAVDTAIGRAVGTVVDCVAESLETDTV